jgi:hypothetical protein
MRNVVADHAILHPFLKVLVKVLEDHVANRRDGGSSIFREFFKILLNRRRLALHLRLVRSQNSTRWVVDNNEQCLITILTTRHKTTNRT